MNMCMTCYSVLAKEGRKGGERERERERETDRQTDSSHCPPQLAKHICTIQVKRVGHIGCPACASVQGRGAEGVNGGRGMDCGCCEYD